MKPFFLILIAVTFSLSSSARNSNDVCSLSRTEIRDLVKDLREVTCIDRDEDSAGRAAWAREFLPALESVLIGGRNESGDYVARAIILSKDGKFEPRVVGEDIREVFANDDDVQAMRIISISENSYTVLSFISRRPERYKISSIYGTVYSPGVKATCEIFRGPYEKEAIVTTEGPIRPDYLRYSDKIAILGGEVAFPTSSHDVFKLGTVEFVKRMHQRCYN